MKPLIQLKNVKHRRSESDLTPCYEATVYVDGKRFARVSNTGGDMADSVVLEPEFDMDDLAKLQKRIASTYPKIRFFGRDFTQDLETVCHSLLDVKTHTDDLRKGMEKDWVFIVGDKVLGFKKEAGQHPDDVTKIIRMEVDPHAVLLNSLSFEEALEKYLQCADRMIEDLA